MENENQVTISNHESNVQLIKDIVSNFIGSLTGKMFSFGLGIMLLNQTKSPLSFGLATIIDPIISLMFMIPIGNIVDYGNHKKIISVNMIIRIISLILFFILISRFSKGWIFIPVILFLIIDSISINFNSTAYSASIHELVNTNYIQRLNSLSQTASSFSMIIAPSLGVVLYNMLGFKSFILISLFSNCISLIILFSMKFHNIKIDKTIKDEASYSNIKKFKSALHYVISFKSIMYTIFIAVLFNLFYSSLVVGIPYIIKEQLKMGNSMIGIIDTSSAIGMLFGGIICNFVNNRIGYKNKIIIPLISTTISFLLLGLILSFQPKYMLLSLVGTPIIFIFSLGLSAINIFISVFLQEHVKSGMLGRVTSIMYTCCTAVMPLGILTFTIIFKHFNNGGVVLLLSALLLSVCLLLSLSKLIKYLNTIQ
jgi:MFS transporter, DHA3 family, macrolide efflux protein